MSFSSKKELTAMDNELLLFDRIEVIKKTIKKYGENNFYISFSGGKDSTVLHYLIDKAIPGNKIPRVFSNTGIEYFDIANFVKNMAKTDDRIKIITPHVNIKKMLETKGYPFKSKEHSTKLNEWQKGHKDAPSVQRYIKGENTARFACPQVLKYQFTNSFSLSVSPYCCDYMKKKPIQKWIKDNEKSIAITGLKREEGGQRANIKSCIITRKGEVVKFHPLLVVSAEWEEWFIEKYNIQLSKLYYPPYNFKRTGCKGCPFALDLQEQLTLMDQYMPAERKQCEYLWQPVYAEYRRIGYRLKKEEQMKLL